MSDNYGLWGDYTSGNAAGEFSLFFKTGSLASDENTILRSILPCGRTELSLVPDSGGYRHLALALFRRAWTFAD
jgi:hypothetical protein